MTVLTKQCSDSEFVGAVAGLAALPAAICSFDFTHWDVVRGAFVRVDFCSDFLVVRALCGVLLTTNSIRVEVLSAILRRGGVR